MVSIKISDDELDDVMATTSMEVYFYSGTGTDIVTQSSSLLSW